MKSIKNALNLIVKGGALSIMSYPGHFEGKKEKKAIFSFISNLDKKDYKISTHPGKSKTAPVFIWIVKL